MRLGSQATVGPFEENSEKARSITGEKFVSNLYDRLGQSQRGGTSQMSHYTMERV